MTARPHGRPLPGLLLYTTRPPDLTVPPIDPKALRNGPLRSRATSPAPDRLVDETQNWEPDRWKGYLVKYAPQLLPAVIAGNNANTLFGEFRANTPSEYAIYMKWGYIPATPLNIACYDPNAMNGIHDNTFVALTHYQQTRHGAYGDSGQWASSIASSSATICSPARVSR